MYFTDISAYLFIMHSVFGPAHKQQKTSLVEFSLYGVRCGRGNRDTRDTL